MTTTETLTLFAILLSPVIAVTITLLHADIKEKRRQKMNLFLTLIATRQTFPIPTKFVDSLNMIDVVFYNNKKVIDSWKAVFASLHTDPMQVSVYNRKLLDLLDAMAKSLGYNNIKQTDFDSFYSPNLYLDQRLFQETLNQEILRVYKNSENLGQSRK